MEVDLSLGQERRGWACLSDVIGSRPGRTGRTGRTGADGSDGRTGRTGSGRTGRAGRTVGQVGRHPGGLREKPTAQCTFEHPGGGFYFSGG